MELPPADFQKVLLFGGAGAIAGAAVWGAIVHFAHTEHGLIAWGIGGVVGILCVKAGGYGQKFAILAGVLALLSIVSGKYFAYQMSVGQAVDDYVASMDSDALGVRQEEAAQWAALGESPSESEVRAFMGQHGFDYETAEQFLLWEDDALRWFHETKPSLQEWKDHASVEIADSASFVSALQADFHPLDILFAILEARPKSAFRRAWMASSCKVVRTNAGESVDSARLAGAAWCGEAAAGGVSGFSAALLGVCVTGEARHRARAFRPAIPPRSLDESTDSPAFPGGIAERKSRTPHSRLPWRRLLARRYLRRSSGP